MERTNPTTRKKRVAHLDAAKALGMFLVFLGHAVERLDRLKIEGAFEQMKAVYAFHMPLFFFLAGVFYKPGRGTSGDFVIEKARTRILPVFFFALICFPFWVMDSGSFFEPLSRGLSYVSGLTALNMPTWFLVCLFVTELMVGLVARRLPLDDRMRLICYTLVVGVIGWLVVDHAAMLSELTGVKLNFWYANEAVVAAAFYLFGHLLRDFAMRPARPRADWALLAVSACLFFGTLGFNDKGYSKIPEVVMMVLSSHGNFGWFYFTAVCGILMAITLCRLLPLDFGVTRFVGNNTLIYLGMSGVALHFCDARILGALPYQPESGIQVFLVAACYSALMMLLFAPMVYLIRRWLPGAVGLNRGEVSRIVAVD